VSAAYISEAFRQLARSALKTESASTVSLGRALYRAGHLTSLDVIHGTSLRAVVRSSRRDRSYMVSGPPAALRCSCTFMYGCKHAAAVLLAVAQEGSAVDAAVDVPRSSLLGPASAPANDKSALGVVAPPPPGLAQWLAEMRAAATAPSPSGRPNSRIAILIEPTPRGVFLHVARQTRWRDMWNPFERLSPSQVRKLSTREPLDGAELLELLPNPTKVTTKLTGRTGAFILGELLAAGRLFKMSAAAASAPLRLGASTRGRLAWTHEDDVARASVELERPGATVIPTVPAHYVDELAGLVGPIDLEGPPDRIAKWCSAPPVRTENFERVVAALPPELPAPKTKPLRVVRDRPRGLITLFESAGAAEGLDVVRFATPAFRYGDQLVSFDGSPNGRPRVIETADERIRIERDGTAEGALEIALLERGFLRSWGDSLDAGARWTLYDPLDWIDFVLEDAAELRADGFEIEMDPSFKLQVVDVDDFYTRLEETSETDWFELDAGIRVGDERVDLLPVLVAALRRGDSPEPDASLYVPLASGALARVPYSRFAPLVDVLLELLSKEGGGKKRISRLRAMDLAEVLALEGKTAKGLRSLRAALTETKKLPSVPIPPGLRVELREYQRDGFRWLHFLGEHALGAVLADDMGLGKTLQLIALIAARRKAANGAPSLVVAPTSVLLSWSEQLEQFAPALRVVRWHGKDRYGERESLRGADVVLTSYALVHRDVEELVAISWDVLVLDEAQAIKNPKAVAGEAARRLTARQRVAVTGTPLENHLGELWSIVSFANAGALGSEKAFKAIFRNPIEKAGNKERLELLRRRVTPILLRRTKEQVATELPTKTVIEVPIELGDAQRDLYETVRRSVDKRVRDAIARRGIALSKIVILDALLKLRQVCCDPSLLKVDPSKKRVPSAKREAFLELIDTLLEEGRRVLVFSQFVEMLGMLAAELTDRDIDFALLTGSTVDRKREVHKFQKSDVPVFLISLKAGGSGLNLTAADTVIHYDPWWNPAVEAQATDRAHRIGQTKPVFVHRMIAKGTVEEKIVALQTKKAELARSLLDGGTGALALDEALVSELLAPIAAR
jgi:superfamily II DNA or RNA helicase